MAGQETFPFLPVAGQGREIRAGERVILTPVLVPLGPRTHPRASAGRAPFILGSCSSMLWAGKGGGGSEIEGRLQSGES